MLRSAKVMKEIVQTEVLSLLDVELIIMFITPSQSNEN